MWLKRSIIIVLILSLGLGLAYVLIKTAPKPQKKPAQTFTPLVETKQLQASTHRAYWQSGSSVNAKPSVKLMAQVSGQLVHMNADAVPGAWIKKGVVLAQIDAVEYELALAQKQAALTQAQSALEVELGQVKNAENNYKLSNLQLNSTAKSLALREPQLASAKAALNIAKAQLKKAQLDLSRTKIVMPFDGFITQVNLSMGTLLNNNTQLFELVDSSEFWLQVKVPQAFADLIDESEPVLLTKSGADQTAKRYGYVKSILPIVDANDRQVRVLVGIKNPLDKRQQIIRYNDFLQATLYSRPIEQVYELKTDALNDDQSIWVVDAKNTLQLRQASLVFKGRERIWTTVDIQPGDALLASQLQVASPNMPVRTQAQNEGVTDKAGL